jgi:hypothetical protein
MASPSKAPVAFKWARLYPAGMRALLFVVAASICGCGESKPDRIAMDPAGPFSFDKKGASETVQVAAFIGPRPFPKKVPVDWESSDTSVATVADGKITATGSGKAKITATAWGLTTAADVSVRIVGSLAVKDDVPKVIKLNGKPVQLHVVVKDDKGVVIDKPERVMFRATDYCVEVDDNGLMKPLTEGDCDVIVSVANQSQRVKLSVKE